MSEFVHQSYHKGETVAAIATAIGEGGVAIVRISGDKAVEVADRVFSKPVSPLPSHQMVYGNVIDEEGERVDAVLLVVMRAPRSFTGEDVVEIHCHGGVLITKRVLDVVLKAGARAALPGEFSFKAFMNGKMDLTQAEAVQELIGAKSDRALTMARRQLEGSLSLKVKGFQTRLTAVAAIVEAWIDFPEEGLEFASVDEVTQAALEIENQIAQLGATFEEGQSIHTGLTLCLAGPPNVGKSSLLNALLGKDRAIVTPIAGTTRDVIEEDLRLGPVHFRVMDTAGIHEAKEEIEAEGIRRSHLAMERADLVVLLLDAACGFDPAAQKLWEGAPQEKTLLVWNKIDLGQTPHPAVSSLAISVKEGTGMERLKEELIARALGSGISQDEVVITQSRHAKALEEAAAHLRKVIEALENGVSPEFIAFDLYACLKSLGRIIGTNVTEDVLSSIFSTFCIGK